MKRLSFLMMSLALVCSASAQSILEIAQEQVCWSTPGGADSSLTRYVLISTRVPDRPRTLCYVDENGQIADVSGGGSFTQGFCGCCAGGSGSGSDADWYFLTTDQTIFNPVWRSGRVAIGTMDTSHQLQLQGDWQFVPDIFGSRFDWQNTTDTTGTSWYGLLYTAPSGLGGSSNLSGGRNNLTVGTQSTVIDRTRLGVLAFAGNNPTDTDLKLSAFLDAVADGAWTASNTASHIDVWVTAPGETFARNTVTFQGDGRLELDRYFLFSDGVPTSLLGFNSSTNDVSRHVIGGTPSPGAYIAIDENGTGIEWTLGGSVIPIQILADADTIIWDLDLGRDAIIEIAATREIDIQNATTPDYVTLYVTHGNINTEINIPGRTPIGFSWATSTNQVTALGGRYDGTEWWWTAELYASGSPYEPETDEFLAVNTGLPDSVKTAINDLVIAMKAIGWTKFQAVYPMVGGSAAAHKWNLVDPRDLDEAFRLTFLGTWIHAADGATPNGTNAYANTYFYMNNPNIGIVNSSLANINSFHVGYYTPDNIAPGASDYYLWGYKAGADQIGWDVYNINRRYILTGDNITATLTGQSGWDGFMTTSRTANNSVKNFRNASQLGSTLTTTRISTTGTTTMYIGANNADGVAQFFSNYTCAFFTIGAGLSDQDVSDYYAAVLAFQNAVR